MSGVLTRQERVAVLDGALGRAYEDFDGLIIAERARAQRQSNEAGGDPGGLYEDQGQGGQGGSNQGSGGLPGVTAVGRPGMPGGVEVAGGGEQSPQAGGSGGSVGGLQGGPAGAETEIYPIPEDIPGGRDDDVVARQIREAAMREPDPELRELLWDEYRRYTGMIN